jgi:hypothetical protein
VARGFGLAPFLLMAGAKSPVPPIGALRGAEAPLFHGLCWRPVIETNQSRKICVAPGLRLCAIFVGAGFALLLAPRARRPRDSRQDAGATDIWFTPGTGVPSFACCPSG